MVFAQIPRTAVSALSNSVFINKKPALVKCRFFVFQSFWKVGLNDKFNCRSEDVTLAKIIDFSVLKSFTTSKIGLKATIAIYYPIATVPFRTAGIE
jgi:hypothetical protein